MGLEKNERKGQPASLKKKRDEKKKRRRKRGKKDQGFKEPHSLERSHQKKVGPSHRASGGVGLKHRGVGKKGKRQKGLKQESRRGHQKQIADHVRTPK